jgi:23S rRNA-/tRNA-specific pseudouridylate synthase
MGRIKIIYQDDVLMVVDKPAMMLTVPTPKKEKITVFNQHKNF